MRSTKIKKTFAESDVFRRQILTTKVDPRAVRVKPIIYKFLSPGEKTGKSYIDL